MKQGMRYLGRDKSFGVVVADHSDERQKRCYWCKQYYIADKHSYYCPICGHEQHPDYKKQPQIAKSMDISGWLVQTLAGYMKKWNIDRFVNNSGIRKKQLIDIMELKVTESLQLHTLIEICKYGGFGLTVTINGEELEIVRENERRFERTNK